MALLGLYRKGSLTPVKTGVTSDDEALNADIGFSIGSLTKGNLYQEMSVDVLGVLSRCTVRGYRDTMDWCP
jgi:hypothetical protein